jgi:hypothetical protein
MKTFLNLLLFCCFSLLANGPLHAFDSDFVSTGRSVTKDCSANSYDQQCAVLTEDILNAENDLVFSVEEEDEEYGNEKHSSDERKIIADLFSTFAESFNSCRRFSFYDTQVFSQNSPLYIAQRVLRI